MDIREDEKDTKGREEIHEIDAGQNRKYTAAILRGRKNETKKGQVWGKTSLICPSLRHPGGVKKG